MHRLILAALLFAAPALAAQSLARRVTASDGMVQVIYPSRADACGDGQTFLGNVFGRNTYYSVESTFSGRGSWNNRPCVHGPVRAVATVISGEVTRVRAYVGPIPQSDARAIQASVADASAWLTELILRGSNKLSGEAMLPLVLADTADPWPFFLRVARDDSRPLGVRRSAMTWLASGVNDKLGLTDARADTDEDEMRKQAIFVLSQRSKGESVPELIEVARTSKHPSARREAIFWLGQTGDLRAIEVYAELLKLR